VSARPAPFLPTRADWAQAGLVGAALLALYAATAPRTVALEDDGLFILSSYFLGVEHPPGYPLYTLLGWLATFLPFGSVAYRVHLVSALFGALTCALLWLCARTLSERRLAAYMSAFALGLTPVFWSQSLIAEVYTFNAFFFALLAYLGLQSNARLLPWMALVFGLSLSNHWPLMLLVAPAFAFLLWPLRRELVRRLGVLAGLVVIGLLPYVWMVRRSWMDLPINFDGPLESLHEVWFFISRSGYAHVDQSASANWLDRVKFFRFQGAQLLYQFALLGTLLAGAGFLAQWRLLERRVSAFLTVAFLMPTAVLLALLGFDYDTITKHMFHVYPLPAYAVVALWIGLGCVALAQRLQVQRQHAAAGGAAVLALIFAFGSRSNLLADYDWAARYARTVLDTLPPGAIVFARSDADISALAYFHLVEGVRPDIELYQPKGLVLGNRLFHPLRTTQKEMDVKLTEFVEHAAAPVTFIGDFFTGNARHDRWLHTQVDRSSRDPYQATIEIPEQAVRFFEQSILDLQERNAWIAYHQDELRRRYAMLLGQRVKRGAPLGERDARHLEALSRDFFGAMGLAEGLLANRAGYSAGAVIQMLDQVRDLMPSDATKPHRSKFFFLRGLVRLDLGDRAGARGDFETALAVWPSRENPALQPLEDLWRADQARSAAR
jgi:predicted membrane-bound dolichyl-phosphate-mannose-protein mannosyltransferase